MSFDFFAEYLAYTAGGEAPVTYHRWSAIAGLGAFLGRDYYFQHGNSNINPNIYAMLIGVSGTRKSKAITTFKKILQAAGYSTIAAEKTSKEKFLLDLAGEDLNAFGSTGSRGDIIDSILETKFTAEEHDYKEVFIMADEFNLFMGLNNMEFISLLGVLWDYEGPYTNRIKTGKSLSIPNPTVSILAGNTPTNFAAAFPPEIIGQGFLSRLLLVYAEPTGRRITFPPTPTKEETNAIAARLQELKSISRGNAKLTLQAKSLLDYIYKAGIGVDDTRFESYNSRRLGHLIKLCLIISASKGATEISETHVIAANTTLSHAEHLMPRALGEFGKAKNSDISHRILQVIEGSAPSGITMKNLWVHVAQDLESTAELAKLLTNLQMANKIQSVAGFGFLPCRRKVIEQSDDTVDYSLLTQEERDML